MAYPGARKKSPLEFLSLFSEAQEGTRLLLQPNRPSHGSVRYPVEGLLGVVLLEGVLPLSVPFRQVG